MAMRGRGRAGFRGGRAGGMGALGGRMPLKDENGQVIDINSSGPAPLFPEMRLPDNPSDTLTNKEQYELHEHFRRSRRSSAFGVEAPAGKRGSEQAEVERLSTQFHKRARRDKPPVASLIQLSADKMPEELWGAADKKAYSGPLQNRPAEGDQLLAGRLDMYEAREQQQGRGGRRLGAGSGGGAGGEGSSVARSGQESDQEEGDEEEAPGPVDEDAEEDMEEDDYYQGVDFDDDEGYDDDDGGDDGGAIY